MAVRQKTTRKKSKASSIQPKNPARSAARWSVGLDISQYLHGNLRYRRRDWIRTFPAATLALSRAGAATESKARFRPAICAYVSQSAQGQVDELRGRDQHGG